MEGRSSAEYGTLIHSQTNNPMQNFYKGISFLLMALVLPLVGCINDDSLCDKDEEIKPGEGITIEFSLTTSRPVKGSTRALIDPSGTLQDGSLAENYLDLNNLTFLLFDDKPEPELLQIISPYVEADNTTPYIKYKVTAFISDQYFLHATTSQLTFSIVVLGNYQSLTPRRFGFAKGMKLADLFDKTKVGTFAMPVSNNWGNSWIPSILPGGNGQQRGYIPMAGMQTFTVAVSDLRASTPESPLVISTDANGKDINMLRALAKIEVIDKIGFINNSQPDKNSRSWIEKVELIGHSTRGSIFPTLAQWNRSGNPYETQYVRTVSIPSDNTCLGEQPTNGLTTDNDNATVNFFEDKDAVELRPNDDCQVFSCYLTEYNPNDRGTAYPMWIRLTVHGPGTAQSSSTLYRLEPAPYIDNTPGDLLSILRNNIYRYEIMGIGSTVDLNLIVDDWSSHETIWNYSDNPGMTDDGYLTWNLSPDITVNTTNAEVVIGNNVTLTGSFAFAEPKGGTWIATFAPEGETEKEAFMFIDESGNKVPFVSGDIDGETDIIKIVANFSPTSFDRKARLIFTVKTFDERIISADVLDDAKYGKDYFTIIQNASL